jgi:acyl-CoA thioester hydrolase
MRTDSIKTEFVETARVRVRYGEVDQMNFAYNAHAAVWFDIGRTELMRLGGRDYRSIEDSGLIMPVLELNVEYHRAAFYDDELIITANCQYIRGKNSKPSPLRFKIVYAIKRGSELLYSGYTVHCFLTNTGDISTRKPVGIPEWFKTAMDLQ